MKKIYSIVAFCLIVLSSCKKEEVIVFEGDGKAAVTFDAKVGSADFALNQNFSINNQTFQFTHFRYWVSNVSFIKEDGSKYSVPNSYYLIEENGAVAVQEGDFTYPANKRETVNFTNIPKGSYRGIEFSIGVDQRYNDNLSLQAGELSQLNGMTNISWMWHTTYIFTALAGKVTEASTTKNIKVETGINSNYKTVTLNFPAPIAISSKEDVSLNLAVDVAKVLDGINVFANPTIGANVPAIMSAVATNYQSKVFSVIAD